MSLLLLCGRCQKKTLVPAVGHVPYDKGWGTDGTHGVICDECVKRKELDP